MSTTTTTAAKLRFTAVRWLELDDEGHIRLCTDFGPGEDVDSRPAPRDYDVPAPLVAEWHRLDAIRRGR